MRGGDLQLPELPQLRHGLIDIGKAEAACGNTPAAQDTVTADLCICRDDKVPPIAGKHLAKLLIAGLDIDMCLIAEARENHPALRILHKALRHYLPVFLPVLDLYRGITVGHTGSAAEKYRRAVLLRILKGLLHHLVGLLHRRRIKARQLGKAGKMPGILLRLGGNRPRVICHQHYHAPLDAYVLKAHEGIRRHVQPHLLHGNQHPGSTISGTCPHFHGGLFVD